MTNRWMAVVLGAAVLAIPGTAVAKGDHGKGHAKKEKAEHHKSHEHGEKGQKEGDPTRTIHGVPLREPASAQSVPALTDVE